MAALSDQYGAAAGAQSGGHEERRCEAPRQRVGGRAGGRATGKTCPVEELLGQHKQVQKHPGSTAGSLNVHVAARCQHRRCRRSCDSPLEGVAGDVTARGQVHTLRAWVWLRCAAPQDLSPSLTAFASSSTHPPGGQGRRRCTRVGKSMHGRPLPPRQCREGHYGVHKVEEQRAERHERLELEATACGWRARGWRRCPHGGMPTRRHNGAASP